MVGPHRQGRDPLRLDRRRRQPNDSVLLAPTLEDAERRGLTEEIETIWLDRGYDSAATRVRLSEARIDDAVIAKKRKRGSRSSRWVCDGRSSGRTPGSPTMAS